MRPVAASSASATACSAASLTPRGAPASARDASRAARQVARTRSSTVVPAACGTAGGAVVVTRPGYDPPPRDDAGDRGPGRLGRATIASVSGDFELTTDELRAVARFVAESAEPVLAVFEQHRPDDPRPRAALEAAWLFVDGAPRSRLQRVTSLDAHRAAKEATTEPARLAARSAGDAASAAYLHPLARASQVGHVLRAAASAARIAELRADGDVMVGERAIEAARRRASPVVVDVLRRYPRPTAAANRVSRLMVALDSALRAGA